MIAALGGRTNAADDDCKSRETCSQCAAAVACGWSTAKQRCEDAAGGTAAAAAPESTSCPKLTVSYATSAGAGASTNQTVTVRVAGGDAAAALVDTLRNSTGLQCQLDDLVSDRAVVAGDSVTCVFEEPKSDYAYRLGASKVMYLTVRWHGDASLQFDDERERYVVVYHEQCLADAKAASAADCASCLWDDYRYRYYCEWCAAGRGGCSAYKHCDVRERGDMRLSTTAAGANVLLVGDRCSEARIGSVEPSAAQAVFATNGTVVRVAVTNHRLLAENRITEVTVAGRPCLLESSPAKREGSLPGDADPYNVACTITIANDAVATGALPDEGPVDVIYRSTDGSSPANLTLRSDRQIFRFAVAPSATTLDTTLVTNATTAKRANNIRYGTGALTVFLIAVTIISLIITIVVSVVYCLRIALAASNQQTEMESLCDNIGTSHNNNDNIDAVSVASSVGVAEAHIQQKLP